MNLGSPACPTCQKMACGILEHLQATANLMPAGTSVDYEGSTDMDYDSQVPVFHVDPEHPGAKMVTLTCPDNHEWSSTWEGDE